MRQILYLFSMLFVGSGVFGQSISEHTFPRIGYPCPDFILKGIGDYTTRETSVKDLKGQFFILDFWNRFCTACIKSFPKQNELQKRFNGKVKIFLIGLQDKEGRINTLYQTIKQRMNLSLPIAFDSVLYKRFVPAGAPHLIFVDDQGIVKAITYEAKPEQVDSFIAKKKFKFVDQSYDAYVHSKSFFTNKRPILTHGNGGEDTAFIYRSLLTYYRAEVGTNSTTLENWFEAVSRDSIGRIVGKSIWPKIFTYQTTGNPLEWLYMKAYTGLERIEFTDSLYGSYYPRLQLEARDTGLFYSKDTHDWFSYSTSMPKEKASIEYVQEVMRKDLKNYFGYEVSIERRRMPYWRLVSCEEAKVKLKTQGGPKQGADKLFLAGFSLKNRPVEDLLNLIYLSFPVDKQPVLIDDTEITGNIDISIVPTITGDLRNFSDFLGALNKNGLNLIKGEKEMKVIVIRDPTQFGNSASKTSKIEDRR